MLRASRSAPARLGVPGRCSWADRRAWQAGDGGLSLRHVQRARRSAIGGFVDRRPSPSPAGAHELGLARARRGGRGAGRRPRRRPGARVPRSDALPRAGRKPCSARPPVRAHVVVASALDQQRTQPNTVGDDRDPTAAARSRPPGGAQRGAPRRRLRSAAARPSRPLARPRARAGSARGGGRPPRMRPKETDKREAPRPSATVAGRHWRRRALGLAVGHDARASFVSSTPRGEGHRQPAAPARGRACIVSSRATEAGRARGTWRAGSSARGYAARVRRRTGCTTTPFCVTSAVGRRCAGATQLGERAKNGNGRRAAERRHARCGGPPPSTPMQTRPRSRVRAAARSARRT